MRISIAFFLGVFFFFQIVYSQSAEEWNINANESYTDFAARSAFGKVHGKIPGVNGEIVFSESDLKNSHFDTTIEPAKLNTNNGKRDKHLRSADFLDVEKYPQIKFVSKKIEKTGDGYQVTGNLTLKDVTKEIVFPFTFENQGNKGIFRGSFTINRRDYNVGGKTKLAGDAINLDIVTVVQK
jgi:polyisoprenoid-binding protein YceI